MYRIFHLIKGLGRGGAEKLLSEGLSYADHTRFQYGYGYFLPWKNALVPDLQRRGSDVVCFNCKNPATMILSSKRLSNFLRRWQADLLHCHLPMAGITGRIAGRMADVPVIYTEHNLLKRYHPWTRRLNLWTWKWQKSVIAVSNEVAGSISSHIASPIPIRVIQNGVATESLVPSEQERLRIRKQWNIAEDSLVVGTVASFRAKKNLNDWIRAAQIIHDSYPGCHFILVGDGPQRTALENQVNSSGLSECFHFAGIQEDVVPYYCAMDVFMISSIFEGLPIALLEAMGMYLPVVATKVGGVPEVVTDGVTGFLVEPRSADFLAAKVNSLLTNPDLRKEFGEAGRCVIDSRFGMKRMVHELEKLYLEILENISSRDRNPEAILEQPGSTIVH